MLVPRLATLTCTAILLVLLPPAVAQTPPAASAVAYLIDAEHPRLLLPQRRLRLLRRERERDTIRWIQFYTYMVGNAVMPERGFASALYYVVSGSTTHGLDAVNWALGDSATDTRQIAIVYDWCQPLLNPAQASRLEAKLKAAIEATASATDVPTVRSRLLAAVALSGKVRPLAEETIRDIADAWWKKYALAPIAGNKVPFTLDDHYALFELFHALRDNLNIDLRESAPKFFTTLPVAHLLSHYPAPYPSQENDYRIPLMGAHEEPDLRRAVLSRAAALAMVSFDTNSQEMQFLQGWLMHDRFLLRSTLGIPYEFLWANPYQPGLSFHYLPNVFYDPPTGRLIVRSTWEDNAVWLYQTTSMMQMFRDGRVLNLRQESLDAPILLGNTVLLPGNVSDQFEVKTVEPTFYYVIGLKPTTGYEIEVEDEELTEYRTDIGGVLELKFPAQRTATAFLRQRGGSK